MNSEQWVQQREAQLLRIDYPLAPDMFPALHIGSATVQVLAPATLTEVECILPEETVAIHRT